MRLRWWSELPNDTNDFVNRHSLRGFIWHFSPLQGGPCNLSCWLMATTRNPASSGANVEPDRWMDPFQLLSNPITSNPHKKARFNSYCNTERQMSSSCRTHVTEGDVISCLVQHHRLHWWGVDARARRVLKSTAQQPAKRVFKAFVWMYVAVYLKYAQIYLQNQFSLLSTCLEVNVYCPMDHLVIEKVT